MPAPPHSLHRSGRRPCSHGLDGMLCTYLEYYRYGTVATYVYPQKGTLPHLVGPSLRTWRPLLRTLVGRCRRKNFRPATTARPLALASSAKRVSSPARAAEDRVDASCGRWSRSFEVCTGLHFPFSKTTLYQNFRRSLPPAPQLCSLDSHSLMSHAEKSLKNHAQASPRRAEWPRRPD